MNTILDPKRIYLAEVFDKVGNLTFEFHNLTKQNISRYSKNKPGRMNKYIEIIGFSENLKTERSKVSSLCEYKYLNNILNLEEIMSSQECNGKKHFDLFKESFEDPLVVAGFSCKERRRKINLLSIVSSSLYKINIVEHPLIERLQESFVEYSELIEDYSEKVNSDLLNYAYPNSNN